MKVKVTFVLEQELKRRLFIQAYSRDKKASELLNEILDKELAELEREQTQKIIENTGHK
ncbi:MAG: hypothetical protein ACP5K2_10300 [bacterium]